MVKAIADLATNAWKAKIKMIDNSSGEVRDEMKRVYRPIEGMFTSFQELGVEIKDHTGKFLTMACRLKLSLPNPPRALPKKESSKL